jgi:hypothetical protein
MRFNPDLQKMGRSLTGRVILTMSDSLSSAHHLNLSRAQHLLVSETILMLQLTL